MKKNRITPSWLRDRMESRIRKFARTYPKQEQLIAVEESIDLLEDYREQLHDDIVREEAKKVT